MNAARHHAVVLGSSLAGLVHAIPLAQRFEQVTLVDRDLLPRGSGPRRGVPQGEHIHLLVPGGVTRLEEMLPGVLAELTAAGAHLIPAEDWRFNMGGGRLDLARAGVRIIGATRPLIEDVVRERVLALDGVEVLDGWSVQGLTTSNDRSRVTGVQLESVSDPAVGRTLAADLVVDTTGRGSRSPRWLADLGYERPDEQRLKVDVHYTTRLFRRRPMDLDGCRNVLVDVPPDGIRGGVALAVEDDRWLVTLIGMVGERPPGDLEAFVDYAGSLTSPDLHEVVRDAEPLGDATHRAFPASCWRRYDRMRRLPKRYVVSGDAVCSFDPRFGQGMTVAIIEAMELGHVLDEHVLDDTGSRLLSAARWAVQDAWDLATGSDLANPRVPARRPVQWRVTNAYMRRLLPAAHRDPVVAATFVHVIGMLARPSALMRPHVVARVLGGRRIFGRRPPQPATVPAHR